MSIKTALKFYNDLNRQQRQFVDEKIIAANFPISKWQSFLSKAAAYDTYGDKARARLQTGGILYFVLAFICFIVTFAFSYLFGAGVILFIALGMAQWNKKKLFNKRDLNNYLRLFFFPLLDILKLKAGEEAKLNAKLDFRNPKTDQDKNKRKDGKYKISEFNQQFVLANVTLLDGALMEFVVGDDFKEMSYWKTGSSGKKKYKRKIKTRHQFLIKISAPKSVYSLSGQTSPAVEVSENDDFYILKYKGKAKTEVDEHVLQMNLFLNGIQTIYSSLKDKSGKEVVSAPNQEGQMVDSDGADINHLLWTGVYFNQYDYDSFDSSQPSVYDYSDTDTFFDS